MLNINKEETNGKLTIILEGRLDTTTAPQLEDELNKSVENAKSIVFDMDALEYISSAGLRILLSAQKTLNKQGEMKLIHVSEEIMEIFEVTGFSDILNIE